MQVFLSYCRRDEERANYIELKCSENYIKILRDKYDLEDFKSVEKYMEQIKTADKCILLISEDYMKSEYCMYEILQVLESQNPKDKIIPIVYYKEIYETHEIVKWIKYWDDKYNELKSNLENLPKNSVGSLFKKLEMYKTISLKIEELISIIVDINSPDENAIDKMINTLKIGKKEDINWNSDLYWFKLDALKADTIEISDYAEYPYGEKIYELVSTMIDRDIHGSHCKFTMRDLETKEVKQLYVNNIVAIKLNDRYDSNCKKYYLNRKNIDAEKEYLEYIELYCKSNKYSSEEAKKRKNKIYNTHRCIFRNS